MYHKTHETKNGTLHYKVIKTDHGYKGQIQHDLHKHPRHSGKVLTRYSARAYVTSRGAASWLGKELAAQG